MTILHDNYIVIFILGVCIKIFYEDKILEIDDYLKIKDFDKDSLFLNIYHFWCFASYLSIYYIWKLTALNCLKMNFQKKWLSSLPNVNLFIDLVE